MCREQKPYRYRSKGKVTVRTLTLCIAFSGTCFFVRPITLLCRVRFENNLAQINMMARQCVANKNHVARSKVKATVYT